MNTRFRTTPLLAAALGAVLLSSTAVARDRADSSGQGSRGSAAGHMQSREPAGNSAPREQAPARNGNHYGNVQHGQGNGSRGDEGSRGNAVPPRGVPGQQGGSSRPPGHADASPAPPRNSGNAWGNGGNAWNTHGDDKEGAEDAIANAGDGIRSDNAKIIFFARPQFPARAHQVTCFIDSIAEGVVTP